MKAHTYSAFSLMALGLGIALSSCVYYPNPVPEMPYTPRRTPVKKQVEPEKVVEALTAPTPVPAPAPTPAPAAPTMSNWAATTGPDPFPAPAMPSPQPAPKPVPSASRPSSAITQPTATPPPLQAQVITPSAPAPVAAPTAASNRQLLMSGDPSKITNDGPIPVATRVEGDPTRVYNPLDPSKTIRIIDKNGNVFPSGKELKVRGTNYHFYVP
ncbi:MAG: hypothetical protein II349_05805 [Akkermansia sp.]|nr:hypothetical protein [Akkermansia sp.]